VVIGLPPCWTWVWLPAQLMKSYPRPGFGCRHSSAAAAPPLFFCVYLCELMPSTCLMLCS
jgi:hypothetical protein